MIKRIKPISRTAIEGMVYQIRYLVNEKKVSDRTLTWHLQNMLSDKGIPTERIPMPPPHLILKNKTYFLLLFDFIGGGVLGVLGISLSSLLGGGGVEAVLGILFSINLSFPIIIIFKRFIF